MVLFTRIGTRGDGSEGVGEEAGNMLESKARSCTTGPLRCRSTGNNGYSECSSLRLLVVTRGIKPILAFVVFASLSARIRITEISPPIEFA